MDTPESSIPIPSEADVAQWLETYAAWYRALGTNFRERERVKRLINRWVTRLAAKPKVERQALLAALIQVEAMKETNKTEEAISLEVIESCMRRFPECLQTFHQKYATRHGREAEKQDTDTFITSYASGYTHGYMDGLCSPTRLIIVKDS